MNRSATLAAGYLLVRERMPLCAVIELLVQRRRVRALDVRECVEVDDLGTSWSQSSAAK